MRIASIAVRLPSLKVSNEDIVSTIALQSKTSAPDLVAKYQKEVLSLLRKAGSRTRFFRDRTKEETALPLLKDAATAALERAGLKTSDIDLLIYCGVGRGFLEPANAYFFADAIGLECPCFDLLDACMSWTRSLQVAYQYLANGNLRHIMIVNAEFTVYECGYPDIFRIRSLDDLQYLFPAFTIGEAAAATIVSSSKDKWRFSFESLPSLASLCSIPLNGYRDFCEVSKHVGLAGPNRFVSFGTKLFEKAIPQMMQLIRKTISNLDNVDIWFPHIAASVPYNRVAQALGIDRDRIYVSTFPDYGNLISVSIPAAMERAIDEGALRRGDSVVLCPASAGMAIAVVEFAY